MKAAIVALLVLLLTPATLMAQNWKRADASARAVNTGDAIKIVYVTGIPDIDASTPCFAYNVRLEFSETDAILKRNMIDQSRGRGVSEVEVMRIPFKAIKELLFGYDAIYAAQEGKLLTAQRPTCNNGKLTTFLQRMPTPLAILYDDQGKRISFVLLAPLDDAVSLYQALAARAKVKTVTPLVFKGIVKERAPLEAPPGEGER